ncbi:MAG: tRNA (adenosine(37)-N6)-threonylcarbamoyltransferase complex transferase subunit TsaD [Candidatus Levybacteria bacterium]|nr:tRNA (adenosine(37)-N6)-threonylcarbamoyltransferase complex transferase subunit TsaD [Candidatus Levybacteria bacterium]
MRILGIETSCDETSAAIVEANLQAPTVKLLSNIISSSLPLHAKTGGIIPEIAARGQVKYIIPVIEQALKESNIYRPEIDTIAVTYGPGLIGSLLVGVETAKTLSYVWNKPIIPVNHLIGHIYANFIYEIPKIPALALIVSGGHTDLVLLKEHGKIKWLGGTRDDAAGEAFDKIGRLLGLSYPGGPAIEKAAQQGKSNRFTFPRPLLDSEDFDFSFSGLKTAVFREVQKIKKLNEQMVNDISAGVQSAVIDVLAQKTLKAAQRYKVRSILLSGGVAANQKLREAMQSSIELFVPPKNLCTDNAAMIASAAFFNYKPIDWRHITADPELYFD